MMGESAHNRHDGAWRGAGAIRAMHQPNDASIIWGASWAILGHHSAMPQRHSLCHFGR